MKKISIKDQDQRFLINLIKQNLASNDHDFLHAVLIKEFAERTLPKLAFVRPVKILQIKASEAILLDYMLKKSSKIADGIAVRQKLGPIILEQFTQYKQ